MLPKEKYRYEIRLGADLLAVEEVELTETALVGDRRRAGREDIYQVEAAIDSATAAITRISVRYKRGVFSRTASYELIDDFLRGTVGALAGRNDITTKLGRYRELDAGLIIFRALTIAHMRARGSVRWTGRVASIDPATLVAATYKQSCRMAANDPSRWIYEPRMGDSEEIEIDADGRILMRRDNRGIVTRLIR
jgi:hypothetical protein